MNTLNVCQVKILKYTHEINKTMSTLWNNQSEDQRFKPNEAETRKECFHFLFAEFI